MYAHCHSRVTGDQNWKSRSRMTQTPEWHKHLETPLGMWIPRWCWEGGKSGLQTPDGLTLPGRLGEKRDGGVSSYWKTMRKKICWSLSPFSHLFPLPSAALANLPDEFSYSQLLAFSFEVMLYSAPRWFSMPLCFPSVKHIIKTHFFQRVIYTPITLHIKYLGTFKGKQ